MAIGDIARRGGMGALQGYQSGNQGGWGSTIGSLAGGALGSFFPGLGTWAGGTLGGGLGGLYDYYNGGDMNNQIYGAQQAGTLGALQGLNQPHMPDAGIMGQLNQAIPGADVNALINQATQAYNQNVLPGLREHFVGRGGGASGAYNAALERGGQDLNIKLAGMLEKSRLDTAGLNQQRLGTLAGYQGQFPGYENQRLGLLGNLVGQQQDYGNQRQRIGLEGMHQGGQFAGTYGANQANRASNLATGVGNFQRNALGQPFENVYRQAQPGWAPGVLNALGNFAGSYYGRG